MDSSLRPRSRPIKDQTKEMLRPKSRLDAQREKEKRQLQMKTFGDLEYRADLDKQLSWNPIARLGYNPDAHKVFKQREPKTGLAFQGGGPRTIKKLKELGYEGAEKAQQGSVITTTNYSFSPVISHEFTHIGFDILKKRRNENPEAFDKKYGEDAGRILKLTESGKLKEEYYIEFFDDLNTRFNTDMLPEDFKEFPKSTIRDAVQSYPSGPAVSIADRGEEKRNKRIAEIEKFQNIDLKRREKGKESLYLDKIDKGILGLMDAAQDILTEQGEPPKAKMKTLSFWEKVGKSFSNLKPVGTRGLYKGGLSAQTEGAFNIDAEGRRRRQDRPEPEQKPVHPLETVPFFQRPMDASTNDRLVGEDDAGNLVYRTMLGNTYTVKLNPDQRTTRAKIQEDVLPKVKDWLQNPKAPSQDQVVQMGKAIAESVYDLISIPGDLATEKRSASDVTLGDVYDTTGMTAVGSLPFKVPENALRTFGGKGARDLDVGAFAQARKLMKDGVQRINPNNPDQFYNLNKKVWNETGWYIDPSDNQWRFEIDDSKSEVILNTLPVTYKEIQDSGGEFKLSDVFKHEDLYKQYPHLKDIIVRFYNPSLAKNTAEQRADVAGYMDSPGNLLAINTNRNTVKEIRETLLHEIQHSIQNYEGFTPGSSSENIDPNVLAKGRDKVLNEIQNLSSDNSGIKVNNTQLLGEVSKLVPIEDFFPAELSKRYMYYGNTTDEIRKDLLDRKINYLSTIVDKHPNADDFRGSETASKVLANIDKLRDNIFKQAAFEFSFPKLATEFYMGAGGEIESRLVEYSQNMTDWQRKNAEPAGSLVLNEKSGNYERMEGFPLDRAKDLLGKEGRYNKPAFRGKEGVDTTAKTRRAIPTENIGSSDIYLDIPKSDFKLQKDSEGKVIPTKKGKHSLPGVDKLKSLFKDEESVLNILNLKRGDTFTLNGKEYKFQRIGTYQLGKNELDRNQFILRPEEGGKYFDIVTVNAEDSLGRPNYISLSKFLDDPEKYIGKSIPDQPTSLFGRVKGKLGLSPSTSQNTNFTLQDFGYYVDNPAKWGNTDWAKQKQAVAEKYAREGGKSAQKLLSGPQTAFLGIDNKKPLYLDTNFLSTLKGANDEVADMSNPKYVDLKKSVEEEGFVPDQKGNKVLIGINHKGEAFIMEGNNRVAIAKEFGAPSVKAEVRYYNGAEEVNGPYSPQNILKYASQVPRQFAEGGAVDMSLDRQMSFAFEEGGLRDDGMNRDPVSGNEVPSGSMAKEVRDDIPAQLSEGEYVVPADVVRYYGVKFFEDLRTEAKMGLQSMEANGRIGGEPVPVGGPKAGENPLTSEEMEMLKQLGMSAGGSVRGFSQGGLPDWVTPPPEGAMVTQVLTTLVNPITGETFTAPTGGYSINYDALQQAESPPKMADFDYFKSAPFQSSYERRPPGSTYFRTQAEIDADKGITTGPKDDEEGGFKNSEEYCASLGMNYDPETQMCVPIEKPRQTSSSDDDPRDPVSPPETKPWYEGISADAEDSVSRYFGTGARIGAGIAGAVLSASPLGLVGGAAGKYGVQGTNIAQARAEIALRTAAGDTEGAALLQSALDKQLKGSVGLAAADKFFENAFNSSGEKNVISALESAGIDVPDSIKNKNFRGDPDFDGELMTYMSKYSKIINEKILKRGAPKVKSSSTYSDTKGTPLKSSGKTYTEKQKQSAASDAGLQAAKNVKEKTGAERDKSRKEHMERHKAFVEKQKSSGNTYSTDTKTAIDQMKDRGTFNVGGRAKGGLMKKK